MLFTFYIQGVLKFKKKNYSGAKKLRRSCTCSAHFVSFIFFRSFLTPSFHRDLGLPAGLPANGFHLCINFTMLASDILSRPPNSIVWALTQFVMFRCLINSSNSFFCFNSPNTVGFLSWYKYYIGYTGYITHFNFVYPCSLQACCYFTFLSTMFVEIFALSSSVTVISGLGGIRKWYHSSVCLQFSTLMWKGKFSLVGVWIIMRVYFARWVGNVR